MLEPSYTQIMEKVNEDASKTVVTSRYSIVIATARRARQIIEVVNQDALSKSEKNVEITLNQEQLKQADELNHKLKKQKPTSIAVDEIYSGELRMKERDIEG